MSYFDNCLDHRWRDNYKKHYSDILLHKINIWMKYTDEGREVMNMVLNIEKQLKNNNLYQINNYWRNDVLFLFYQYMNSDKDYEDLIEYNNDDNDNDNIYEDNTCEYKYYDMFEKDNMD